MFRAFSYAIRFLVVGFVTVVVVSGATRSESIAGLAAVITNTFVLFTTIDRFVDAKLAAEYDLGDEAADVDRVDQSRGP